MGRYGQQFYITSKLDVNKVKLAWYSGVHFMELVSIKEKFGHLEVPWNSCPQLHVIQVNAMEYLATNGLNFLYFHLRYFQQVELNIMI